MGINIKQDYSNIEESLLGGLKDSLIKKGQEEIQAAFDELFKKPIKINGKKIKVDISGFSDSVYQQLLKSFSEGKKFSPKVNGFDLSNMLKLDEKALAKKMKELSSFINNASFDVSEKELSSKTKHFMSAYLVSKNKGFNTSKFDDFYKNITAESDAQEQAIKKIEEQLLANSIANSSELSALANKISEKYKGKDNKRNIEILGKIFDADTQLDEISKEMDALIANMKNIVFHAGKLDKKTLKSKDYSPADNLKFAVQRGRFDSQGSGTFFSSNLVDVLDWYNSKKSDGDNRRIYADDLSKYSKNMFKLSSDEMSQDYSEFLERLSRFVMLVATSEDKYKNALEKDGISSLKELYLSGEDYFENFNITINQLDDWIKSEAEYIKSFSSIDEMGKSHSINTRFQQQLLGVNGVDATNALLDDSVARGSIVFEIDKNNPYVIDFGDNTDIAEMFYDKVMERIISDKSKYALSEDDLRDIVDAYIPDALRGSVVQEELENKLLNGFKKTYVDDYEALNKFGSADNGELDSKTTEQILDESDALDENLQKQKQLTEAKKETVQAQKELNKVEEESLESSDLTSAILEGLKQAQEEFPKVKEEIKEIKDIEETTKSSPIINNTLEDKLRHIKDEYADFEEMVYGGDAVHRDDKLEYFNRLRTALQSLTEEDIDNLDLGEKFSIDKFAAKLETTTDDMHLLFEEVYNLGDNDEWSDEYTVLEGVDEEYKSIYKDIKYICDILEVAKVKNSEAFESSEQHSVTEKKEQEVAEIKKAIEVKKEEIATIKEVVDAHKDEESSIKEIDTSTKKSVENQIDDYNRIKQQIKETREEIDKLNSQDIERLKMPKYIDDVYTAKTNKYSQMSADEFNDKIIEKSKESLSTATRDFRVQMTSILAMIDEAKKRGQSLKFEDLISGSPDELKIAKDYFEKIVSYISSLNDESFIDDVPQKLANATQKLRDLNTELKDVAENSSQLNFFDYKLNEMIGELSGKRKGINQDEANKLIQLTSTISKLSGKEVLIGDYTDNEKIIAGVTRQLELLKQQEERAAQAARDAALAEKQQAEANEQTTLAVKEQTAAVEQNTGVQEENTVTKTVGVIPLPNSIKAGFKDEGGVVQGVVAEENTSLELLKNKIFEVRDAIESKTLAFTEELSTVERVVGDERTSLDLLRDKLAQIKGYTEELYKQIGNIGKIDFSGKIKVDGLSTLISSLKDDKLNNKLTAIYTYLDDFAKAVNGIDFKNNLTEQLNTILSKGEELKNLASILKSSNKKIKNAGKTQETKELQEYNNAYKGLISTEERYQQLKNKQKSGETLTAKEASDLVKIEAARQRNLATIAKTTDEIKEQSKIDKEYANHQKEITDAINASAEAQRKLNAERESTSLKNNLQKQIDDLSKMEFAPKFTEKYSDEISSKIRDAVNVLANGTNEEIENTIALLKQFKDNIPKSALESTYLALSKNQKDISRLLADNTRMSKGLKEELVDMYEKIQRYKDGSEILDDKDLVRIKKRIIEIEAELDNTNQKGDSLGVRLKKQLSSIWQRDIARYLGLNDIIRYIRQISNEVIKLDTALTELRKVSGETDERLQQSLNKSTETAKELGSTIEDVINVTADWARLGYNVDEAEELARVTTLFKNVGDNMSAEDASSYMISTLKGFEMEADKAMDIADKFNEVANNFAIDTQGIGEALQRSAASFNAANTDLNESIALITATNAVVQNPESVGTLWKTVSARIRGAKAELEDMGEDTEGMVESTSKLRALVKGMTGFDIMEDEKTFKSIYDIVLGIGEKWEELNDIDRAALLEALAGKRGGNALAATLNNVKDLKESYETALNASGSAAKEQANYERSIQYSIDRLKATAQDLAQDFMSSDFIKSAVDALNRILELLDSLIEKTGSLIPLVTALGGAFAAIKFGQGMSGIADVLGGLLGDRKESFSLKNLGDLLGKPISEAFGKVAKEGVETAAETLVDNSGTITKAVTKAFDVDDVLEDIFDNAMIEQAERAAEVGVENFGEASELITRTALPAEAATKEMAAGIKTAGVEATTAGISLGALVGILAAIAVAVGVGIAAWDYYTTTVEEVEQQIDHTKKKIEELESEIKELNSIDDRNEYQNNRLQLLNEELRVQKEILEIEEKRRLAEKYGTKFEDAFDENNQNTKARKLMTGQDASNKIFGLNAFGAWIADYVTKQSEGFYKNSVGIYDNIPNELIKTLWDKFNKEVVGSVDSILQNYENKKIGYENVTNTLNKKREQYKKNPNLPGLGDEVHKLEEQQDALKAELDTAVLDIQELLDQSIIEAAEIQKDLDSGLLSGEDKKNAEENLKGYKALINSLKSILTQQKKEEGTYDFFESYDFYDAIKNDENALKDLINTEDKDIDVKNEIKNQYPTLIALMDKEGLTIDDLIEKYQELSDKKEETLNAKYSKSEMINQITDLADGFDKLDEVYADVFDKGAFDFTKLSTKKFEEAFKGLKDEYTEFIETVSAHPDDLNASQDAFNKLAQAYVEHSGVLKGLSEDTKDLTINMLENMGIANAQEVVEANLAKIESDEAIQKEYLAATGRDLADATAEEIQQLLNEGAVSEQTAQKMADFALKKIAVNNATINTAADCENILNLARIAVYGTEVLERLETLKSRLSDPFVGKEMKANINTAIKDILSEAQSEAEGVSFELPQYEYKGAEKTRGAIDKANKSAEESKEIIDWIEKALQRQEEQINRIDKVVNATYKDWSKRNSSLLSEINEINKEIGMQTQAYQAYLRDAEAVPLAEEYKRLVREGAMHAETITDKTLKKNIDQYTELYDKAIKAKDAIADLEAKIAALAKAKFDNVKSEFEGFTSEIEHFVNMIDKELPHIENMEKIAGKSFYNAKIDQDYNKLEELNRERSALVQAMNDAVANGVEVGSADWVAMRNDIYSVDEAIADLTYEVEDLKKKLKEVAKLNFDDLKSQFENALSIINNQKSLTDAVVSMVETSGHMASRAYYQALIKGSKETVTGLRKEYETLSKTLADAMAAGDIEKYDKQWYEMQNDIASVKNELVEAANATIEYANALRQINWDTFDRGVDTIGKLVDEAEFFIELLSYEDLFDKKTGEWTKAGISTRGLMVEEYQSYMNQSKAYGKEAENIRKLLEKDPKNTTLIDRYYELIEAQRQAILNAKKEKKAVEDLYKDAYDNLLDRIKKLIDEYKEALNAAKDLHDYQNTIDEKTKAIGDIQKQILAYSGDDSEETRATLQKLNSDLVAAQKDLQETEYDRYIQDQENLLDDFYSDLEEWINGRMDEVNALFEEAIAATNLNGKLINETLHEEANSVGIKMTDEFARIWEAYSDADGIAASSLNILTLVNGTTDAIREKMNELPTEARLEEFFNSEDLKLLQELTSVKENTSGMISAINSTNSALAQIQSNIVEYSGLIANKLDSVSDAVNNLDLSVDVNVDASTGSTSVSGGGGGSGSGSGGAKTDDIKSASKDVYEVSNSKKTYTSHTTNPDTYVEKANQELKNDAYNYAMKQPSSFQKRYDEYIKNAGGLYTSKKTTSTYKRGGIVGDNKNYLDSIARLLGEDHMVAAREGERILTEEQNKNFEKMVNANFTPLESSLKDKYSMLSGVNGKDIASMMANMPTPNVGNLSNVGNTTTVGDINITLPNITDKEQFVNWLKTDGQIEKIVQSMTIGRMSGGNSFNKMKY